MEVLNKFKIEQETRIVDGVKQTDDVLITEYSPNGRVVLKVFRIRVADVPQLIKLLQDKIK